MNEPQDLAQAGGSMTIQVTGKNVGAGEAFQGYVTDKISVVLDKYIGPELFGHVRVEKARTGFRTSCSLRLKTGLLLESQGEGADAYASADAALEHLEKRVRRYKRRLKSHHHGDVSAARETATNRYVVQLEDEEAVDNGPASAAKAADAGPVIVAESEGALKELSVSEAVMQLDLTDDAFLLFRNASHGRINVVHRRPDGNVGWIDPEPQLAKHSMNGVTKPR
jgi:ribosomal subunit interface protein